MPNSAPFVATPAATATIRHELSFLNAFRVVQALVYAGLAFSPPGLGWPQLNAPDLAHGMVTLYLVFALVMLLTITLYHLSDYLRGPIVNPFYHDMGYTKLQVAAVRGTFGLWATITGVAAGGFCSLRLGFFRTLITGAVSDISPDGASVTQYKLPDPMVTNVCFGGKDLRTAYATLSMTGKLVSFEWPRPGLALEYLNK